MKAWRIQVAGFEDAITHAESRKAAKYRAWKSSREAGYEHTFAELRVVRAPEYDRYRHRGREFVEGEMSMAHHGDKSTFPEELPNDFLKKALDAEFKKMREKEGQFPEGKIRKDDEGSIMFAVGTEKDTVVIQFVEPVKWIGMNPSQAMEMAQLLIKHARSIKSKSIMTLEL